MRRVVLAALIVLLTGGIVFGEDDLKPEQLKKMYDDALVQLKQAQDRKNELAADNDRLNARVADLQKQLDAAKQTVDNASREAAGYAEKTFFLRAQYAAWQQFLTHYPKLEAQWKIFLDGDDLSPRQLPEFIDKNWPLSAAG